MEIHRGNWRKESTSAPSLLTKSCHDIDLILWLLSSSRPDSQDPPHQPSSITSSGSLAHFKRSRKPALAGTATNCLSCPAEHECQYSAKKIYYERGLMSANTGWPLKIVVPDIEECLNLGLGHAQRIVLERLAEDYDACSDQETVDARGWYGRCVYESDNDVCDDQVVTITWKDDDPSDNAQSSRGAKTATIHLVAFAHGIGPRRTRIYGSRGEVIADGNTIKVTQVLPYLC
jgi:predicted dehydrogenase